MFEFPADELGDEDEFPEDWAGGDETAPAAAAAPAEAAPPPGDEQDEADEEVDFVVEDDEDEAPAEGAEAEGGEAVAADPGEEAPAWAEVEVDEDEEEDEPAEAEAEAAADDGYEDICVEQKFIVKKRSLTRDMIRCVTALNSKGLWPTSKRIDLAAIRSLATLPEEEVFDILNSLEAKGAEVTNPNQYIQKAVRVGASGMAVEPGKSGTRKRDAAAAAGGDGANSKRPKGQEAADDAAGKGKGDTAKEGEKDGAAKEDGKGKGKGKEGKAGKAGKGKKGKGMYGPATAETVELRLKKLEERGVELDGDAKDVLRKVNVNVATATLLALDDRAELPDASEYVRHYVQKEQERQLADAVNEKVNRPPPLPNAALFRMRVGYFLANQPDKGGKKGKGKDKGKGKGDEKGKDGKGKEGGK